MASFRRITSIPQASSVLLQCTSRGFSNRVSVSLLRRSVLRQKRQLSTEKPTITPTDVKIHDAVLPKEQNGKKKWLRWVGIASGIPIVSMGVLVLVLQYNDDVRIKFQNDWPEVIAFIEQYHEVGGIHPPEVVEKHKQEELVGKYVNAIVTTQRGKEYRVDIAPDSSLDEVLKAMRQSGASASEAIQSVYFPEEGTEDQSDSALSDSAPHEFPEDMDDTTENYEIAKLKPVDPALEARRIKFQLASLRGKEDKLKDEMKTGFRDFDTIQEELDAIVESKKELKARLPKKTIWARIFG